MMAMTMTTTMSQRMSWPMICPVMSRSFPSSFARNRLEGAGLFRQRQFHRQALHRGGAIEPMARGGVLEDVIGVPRLGDRAAVREDDDLGVHPQRRLGPRIDQGRAVVELQRGFRPDRAAGGQAHV